MRDDPVRPKRADRVIPLRAPSAPSFSVRKTGAGLLRLRQDGVLQWRGRCPGSAAGRDLRRRGLGRAAAGASGSSRRGEHPGAAAGAHGQQAPPAAHPGASGYLRRRGLGRAGAARLGPPAGASGGGAAGATGTSGGGERGRRGAPAGEQGPCSLGLREL
nr:spidroin-1-like [Setaria viridis]